MQQAVPQTQAAAQLIAYIYLRIRFSPLLFNVLS